MYNLLSYAIHIRSYRIINIMTIDDVNNTMPCVAMQMMLFY